MKKVFTAMALSLAITLSFGLAACNKQPSKGGSANGGNGKFNELNTTESVYGFSAASAGMIISSMNAAGTTAQTARAVQNLRPIQTAQTSQSVGLTSVSHASAPRVSATNLCSVAHVCAVPVNSSADDAENAPVEETPDTSETPDVSVPETPETSETPEKPGEQPSDSPETAELDRYMALVESLLSDGGFDFSSQTSDREGYAEKTVISYKDMSGDAHDYVMYFNQTLTKSETDESDSEDESDDEDEDESDGETEENYSIKGVMVIDGADYEIRGERKNESEEGESETETEFVVILGENRYIRVEQSVETEDGESEQEYCYSVYENGKLVERSEFSYETEENETELKMTSFKDGKTQVLYFEREIEKGEEVIEIHVGDGKHGKGYIVHIEKDENGDNRYSFIPTDFDD